MPGGRTIPLGDVRPGAAGGEAPMLRALPSCFGGVEAAGAGRALPARGSPLWPPLPGLTCDAGRAVLALLVLLLPAAGRAAGVATGDVRRADDGVRGAGAGPHALALPVRFFSYISRCEYGTWTAAFLDRPPPGGTALSGSASASPWPGLSRGTCCAEVRHPGTRDGDGHVPASAGALAAAAGSPAALWLLCTLSTTAFSSRRSRASSSVAAATSAGCFSMPVSAAFVTDTSTSFTSWYSSASSHGGLKPSGSTGGAPPTACMAVAVAENLRPRRSKTQRRGANCRGQQAPLAAAQIPRHSLQQASARSPSGQAGVGRARHRTAPTHARLACLGGWSADTS